MKSFLSLFLSLLCIVAFAASRHVRHQYRHISAPRKTLLSVPWKTVAAGGAATGTVIAAYKVSDGIEDGIRTVAKEKPEVFADTLSVLTWPIRWAAFILFLLSGCWIWKKWLEHKITTPKGSKPWKSF
jgi:hypothetical protein